MDVSACGWRAQHRFVSYRFWFLPVTQVPPSPFSPKTVPAVLSVWRAQPSATSRVCACVWSAMPAQDPAWVWICDWSNSLWHDIFTSEPVFRIYLFFSVLFCLHILLSNQNSGVPKSCVWHCVAKTVMQVWAIWRQQVDILMNSLWCSKP